MVAPISGVELTPGSTVAMKIYLPSLLHGFQALRVQREFSVASELLHENLARVYDLVLSPSRPFNTFMVMEYVKVPTLKSFIEQKGKLSLREVVTIACQLFSALAELHSVGAIHRDVKAANIMLDGQMLAGENPTDLKLKLVDLGIVSLATDDQFTAASVFLGSKRSAPLEQLSGGEPDERTDIYGAGSVLFHCIRGVPMYQGVGPEGAIVMKMLSTPERLDLEPGSGQVASVQQQLVNFVNRCISVTARERPGTAQECLIEFEKMRANVSRIAGQAGSLRMSQWAPI